MKMVVPTWNTSYRNSFANDFDKVFDHFFNDLRESRYDLSADVQESEKYFLLSFDLPGLDEKDINIEIKDSFLTISGERKKEVSDQFSHRFTSRNYGSFRKKFKLPETIDLQKIEADYTQGVLKILLTKKEEAKPQRIEIQSKKGNLLSQLFKGKEDS